MLPRHDRETAKLIDFSIGVLGSHGMYFAARLLCERGVSLETVCRVLQRPSPSCHDLLPASKCRVRSLECTFTSAQVNMAASRRGEVGEPLSVAIVRHLIRPDAEEGVPDLH